MTTLARRGFLGRLAAGGVAAGGLTLGASHAWATAPGVSDTPLPRLLNNHRIIVDTDPGNDDAIALLMALTAPSLSVEAITVTPGNVDYDKEVRNALYVVDLAGRGGQVPVHRGMTHPILSRSYATSTFIHGADGLGDAHVTDVAQKPDPEHAVDAIRRIVRKYPGEVVIAALGGLSNVAMALLIDPGIAPLIKGIQFVGSAGNAVPGFNALVDPEAVQIVLNSGVALTIGGGGDASTLTPADFATIAAFDTKFSRFFIASNRLRLTFEMSARGAPGSVNADPLAIAMLIDPAIATKFLAIHASVELNGTLTRGDILFGENRYNMQPTLPANANLCIAASNEGFKRVLFETLRRA